MASKWHQLKSKAAQASQIVLNQGTASYKQLLEQNKEHIVHPPTVETCREISKKLFYTRLASIPSRYGSFWKELDGTKHLWSKRHELKVEDIGVATLFALELYGWSCMGEIAGRGFAFTGYYV